MIIFRAKNLEITNFSRNFAPQFRRNGIHNARHKIADMVNVAQLVRATDCGSVGRGFETHLSPQSPQRDDENCFGELL